MTRLALLVASLPFVAGCLWTTPEQAAEDALPYDGREGPTHMPGYPCLACHSDAHSPGEAVFVLAGTVYERANDAYGVGGVEVHVTDDRGRELSVTTNEVGNFMVRADGDGERGRGEIALSYTLDWPLTIELRRGTEVRHMRSRVHREGSCAACHALGPPTSESAGQVFLIEDAP